jgi:F-type H+-transporting ATPase subunit a
MTRADLAISAAAEPIYCPGGHVEGEHCSAGTILPITNSLIMTVLVDILLLLTIIFGVRNMQLIPRGFQNVVEFIVEGFYNFAQSVDRKNVAKFFPMCASIFFFVLYSNYFALVPGVGSIGVCRVAHAAEAESTTAEGAQQAEGAPAAPAESSAEEPHVAPSPAFAGLPGYCADGHVVPYLRAPSADLNVTLAWALVAVFMVELFGFQALGLGYLTKFFNFKEGGMGFFVGILELISEFVRIIAFSFRLFGNIFAGEVVLAVMAYLFAYLLPLPFYGLELFVAFMQAFIFSVLTLVFMSIATIAHGGHDEHGHPETMPIEAADLPGHGGSH